MEFSANTKPSEGLSRGADDSGVLGIKHGAMIATRKEIKWQEGLWVRLRGTRLVMKSESLLGRTCGYSLDVRDSTTIVSYRLPESRVDSELPELSYQSCELNSPLAERRLLRHLVHHCHIWLGATPWRCLA